MIGIDHTADETAAYTVCERCHVVHTSANEPARGTPAVKQMKPRNKPQFSAKTFPAKAGTGRAIKRHADTEVIFSQADPADALFSIRKGKVRLTVVSNRGKQAVIAILGTGVFFGEGCLAGQPARMSSAAAMGECALVRLDKAAAMAAIRCEPAFCELFLQYALSRNIRIEEDLVDQLFNSSEKKLARVTLAVGELRQGGQTGTGGPEDQPADARGDRWLYPLPGQLLYESIPPEGLRRL